MNRRSAWFIAGFVLLVLGAALGLRGGSEEWGAAETRAQHVAAGLEIAYGVAGLAAAAALWFGHPRTMVPVLLWALLITVTGGVAPVVWGDAPPSVGLWSALASGIVAVVVVWVVRRGVRAGGPRG